MTNKTEDKFYFGNIGMKAESELTVRITKMLGEVERAVLSRNQEKAKSIASKVREMIRKSANTSTAKMQMDELNSIMLGVSFSRAGKADRFGMAEQVMRDGSVHLDFSAARDYLAKQSDDGLRYIVKDAKAARDAMGTEGRKFHYYTDLVLEAQRELKKRGFSRPGQPERFAREVIARKGNKRVELSGPMADGRWTVTVMEENKQVVPGEVNERFVDSKFYSTEAGARRAASKMLASRPGQPERFARSYSGNSKKLNSGAVVAAWDDGDAVQFANATQAQAFSDKHGLAGVYQSPSSRTFFVLASKSRSSRPGQPERFMRDIPVKSWKKGAEDYEAGITEDSGRFQPYVNMPKSGTLVTRNAPTFKSEAGARKWLSEYLAKQGFSRPGEKEKFSNGDKNRRLMQVLADADRQIANKVVSNIAKNYGIGTLQVFAEIFDADAEDLMDYVTEPVRSAAFAILQKKGMMCRPGQPDKFDASSLDRKGFAEASSSPMLGKLLSEKQMPEGGWRAVETGGGALVISFEDADVAGNFARRVAGSGYSATAPVQSIGRYWNVEVKNG